MGHSGRKRTLVYAHYVGEYENILVHTKGSSKQIQEASADVAQSSLEGFEEDMVDVPFPVILALYCQCHPFCIFF